jgi:Au+-exporting ATPase
VAAAEGLDLPPVTGFAADPGVGVTGLVGGRQVQVGTEAMMAGAGIALDGLDRAAADLARAGKTPLFVSLDHRIAAVLAVADPPRADAATAMAALLGLGIDLTMISGDRAETAQAVADGLGISRVIARVRPEGKVAALCGLPGSGPTAFVGDGINDAPVLAAADVGIAIGSGTDVAVEAAEVVLISPRLTAVADALRLSRATMANIRQNLFWAFAYNAALIPVAAGAVGPGLSPPLAAGAMALSSLFVLGNALRLRRLRPLEGASP